MSDRRRPEEHDRWKTVVAALVVSLLLNYVFATFVLSYLIPDAPEPPKETEIVMVEDAPKAPPAPDPATEAPGPDLPAPAPVKQETPRKRPVAPTPIPTPSQAQDPVAGIPEGPPLPDPVPTSPEPPTEAPRPSEIQTQMKWGDFERTFGPEAVAAREGYHKQSMEKRRGKMRFGALTGKVRRALANNRSWVAQGEQVPLGQKAPIFRNYIKEAHNKIHQLFADSFLASLNSLDPDDPLNDFSLMTKMEFEILETGVVNEIRVIRTSGSTVFDAAAVDSLYRASPYPAPPKAILSWNRRVYFRWGFYRNHRMCGVFNAEPYLLRAPGAAPEDLSPEDMTFIDG